MTATNRRDARDGQQAAPRFPDREFTAYLRGRLHFQQLVHDFLRSPVAEC